VPTFSENILSASIMNLH